MEGIEDWLVGGDLAVKKEIRNSSWDLGLPALPISLQLSINVSIICRSDEGEEYHLIPFFPENHQPMNKL